jgi:hypothetical protein
MCIIFMFHIIFRINCYSLKSSVIVSHLGAFGPFPLTSYEINDGRNGIGTVLSPSFFGVPC